MHSLEELWALLVLFLCEIFDQAQECSLQNIIRLIINNFTAMMSFENNP